MGNTLLTFDGPYYEYHSAATDPSQSGLTIQVPEEEKERMATCLRLTQFGMGNTLLTFDGRYYEYRSAATDPSQSGLTIGGYESAWLADLVASYLFIQTKDVFSHTSHYNVMYRDDGIAVLQGN